MHKNVYRHTHTKHTGIYTSVCRSYVHVYEWVCVCVFGCACVCVCVNVAYNQLCIRLCPN